MIARNQVESHFHHLIRFAPFMGPTGMGTTGKFFLYEWQKSFPFFLQNCAGWPCGLSGEGLAIP
jgi:hypothetical protein